MKYCCLIIGLLLAAQAAAQEQGGKSPAAPNRVNRITTLEELDQALVEFRGLPWRVNEMAAQRLTEIPPERSGRRMEDDVSEFVLTEPTLARIADLRNKIAAQGGTSISEDAIKPLMDLVKVETCRALTISDYWAGRHTRAVHGTLIEQVIEYMGDSDRPAARRELDALNARGDALRATLPAGIGSCETSANSPQSLLMRDQPAAEKKLVNDYHDLRTSLLSIGGTAGRIAAATPRITRTADCPAPAPPRAGTAAPAIRSKPDFETYYPTEAQADWIGGNVRVRLHYNDTGCVLDAAVAESSGARILDTAAMRFGIDVTLLPGVVDGKPAESYVVLPVRFSTK